MSIAQYVFDKLNMPPLIADALADGFDLAISISGGKDSDAMARLLVALHRRHNWSGRLCLLHSDLGRAEHVITPRYVRHFAEQFDVPLHVIDGGDLVNIMQARMHKLQDEGRDVPFWPSAKARYCTSSTKRDPITKFLRGWAGKEGRVICAIGLRAEESLARSRKPVVRPRPGVHTQTRIAYDWLPIHDFTLADVWQTLGYSLSELEEIQQQSRGMTPEEVFEQGYNAHPAYFLATPNERLSCALCIFGSVGDLRNGAYQNPAVYREYVQMEIDSGYSFQPHRRLSDIAPELLTKQQRQALQQPHTKQLPLFEM